LRRTFCEHLARSRPQPVQVHRALDCLHSTSAPPSPVLPSSVIQTFVTPIAPSSSATTSFLAITTRHACRGSLAPPRRERVIPCGTPDKDSLSDPRRDCKPRSPSLHPLHSPNQWLRVPRNQKPSIANHTSAKMPATRTSRLDSGAPETTRSTLSSKPSAAGSITRCADGAASNAAISPHRIVNDRASNLPGCSST